MAPITYTLATLCVAATKTAAVADESAMVIVVAMSWPRRSLSQRRKGVRD
jgi:hypothetical protein